MISKVSLADSHEKVHKKKEPTLSPEEKKTHRVLKSVTREVSPSSETTPSKRGISRASLRTCPPQTTPVSILVTRPNKPAIKGLNAVRPGHPTLLTAAIESGDLQTVQFLLEQGANPSLKDGLHRTPLETISFITHREGKVDHTAEIATLLKQKKNVKINVLLDDGSTLLTSAIRHKNVAFVTWLLENGADPSFPDGDDYTPLCSLSSCKLQNKEDERRLFEIGQLLLDYHADLQGTGPSVTPLTAAIFHHNLPVARWLLKNGADANKVDGDGELPLHIAKKKKQSTLMALLIAHGADERWTHTLDKLNKASLIWTLQGRVLETHGETSQVIPLEGGYEQETAPLFARYFADFMKAESTFSSDSAFSLEDKETLQEALDQIVVEKWPVEEMIERLSEQKPVFMMKVCDEHVFSIVIHYNRIMICNRGKGREFAVSFYEINPDRITEEFLHRIEQAPLRSVGKGHILESFGARFLGHIDQQTQKVGNCPWVNIEAGFLALLTSLLLEKGMSLEESTESAKAYYKDFTAYARVRSLDDYLEACQGHPNKEVLQQIQEKIRHKPDRFTPSTREQLLKQIEEQLSTE